ncbi:hypothetical protein QL285_075215 [Trifolium repens]|nr:hypothetical protein QL285_075215 [Trifolium repens]
MVSNAEAYEENRQKTMQENRKRMEALNLPYLSRSLQKSSPPTSKPSQMPPKEQLKVKKKSLKKNDLKKNTLRKNRVILPHMVTQAAQQVQPVVAPLRLDDNATTLAPQSVRQQVEMPPLRQMNEMRQSEAVTRMMPTPSFEPHSTIHPSRENHVSPPPTTNHSPSQPLTSVSSRPTPLPSNLPPPIPTAPMGLC